MAGPVRADPKNGGLYTDTNLANVLNGLATLADALTGERREGAKTMLKAVCDAFGLRIELREERE